MIRIFILNICLLLNCVGVLSADIFEPQSFVQSSKQIVLQEYPNAHNPSIVKTKSGILLTFRHCPDPAQPWISDIGIVKLNKALEPISKPQLLNTRILNSSIPPQSEDARIFTIGEKIYVIYNDNIKEINPGLNQRRDMFIARVNQLQNRFVLSKPILLKHATKYKAIKWQKNWVPFESNKSLRLAYSIAPHEILSLNRSGVCTPVSAAKAQLKWDWGQLRGGTPALLLNGKYLAFFHSSMILPSQFSQNEPRHHYFMGAYTFSAKPPFEVTHISPSPIVGENFYTPSHDKKVVFPGGFIVSNSSFYVAYGKDDKEIWIAKINREGLEKSLKPVSD